MNFLADEE
jgi:hypothetical protein